MVHDVPSALRWRRLVVPGAPQLIGECLDAGGLVGHLPHHAVEFAGARLPAVPVPGSGGYRLASAAQRELQRVT